MKRLFAALCTSAILVGCSLDELRHEISPSSGRAFSVEEAKEFFEKDYVEQITRSGSDGGRSSFRSRFHPGDFTPLWDKAVYSESDGVAAYDVAILSGRKVFAIRSKFGPSGARAEKLHVHQKLVVRRNVESGRMSAYVLSLIPDVGCDDRRIPERFLSRGKDKGGFSGIAIYSTTDRGAVVRVQEYKDGVKVRGVYVPSGSGTYLDRCRQVLEILRGTVFMSRRNIVTRSGEDDCEDWDDEDPEEGEYPDEGDPEGEYVWDDTLDDRDYSGWDINNLEDLGDGIYTDGEGNYYEDIDGDGDLDLEIIAPGNVEDEYPEEPESPPLNPDDLFPPTPPDPEPGSGDGDGEENELPEDEVGVDNPTVPIEPSHLPDVVGIFNSGLHFTKYSDANNNCLDVCKRTMDKMGQSNYGSSANVVYLVRENDSHTALEHYGDASQYYTIVTDCINRHLGAGLAIIAGVNHTLDKKYNDGTIDHFVLIVGREYNNDTKLYEYLYVETGTDSSNNAYRPENRFIFDLNLRMYMDDSASSSGAKKYTLTELRPNDGNNSGTISQPAKRIFRFFKRIWS